MDLQLDDDTLAFQAEVRDFLAANAESIPTKSYDNAEGFAQHRHWDKVLFDAGLSVITWPKKYGGRDAPLLHLAPVACWSVAGAGLLVIAASRARGTRSQSRTAWPDG